MKWNMQGTCVQVAMSCSWYQRRTPEQIFQCQLSWQSSHKHSKHTHLCMYTHTNIYSLTDNFDKAILGFGRHRVDLAHIPTHILLLYVVDVQKPGAMLIVFVVRYTNPRISRYHMIMHRQNGRLLKVHPRHLQLGKNKFCIQTNSNIISIVYKPFIGPKYQMFIYKQLTNMSGCFIGKLRGHHHQFLWRINEKRCRPGRLVKLPKFASHVTTAAVANFAASVRHQDAPHPASSFASFYYLCNSFAQNNNNLCKFNIGKTC